MIVVSKWPTTDKMVGNFQGIGWQFFIRATLIIFVTIYIARP